MDVKNGLLVARVMHARMKPKRHAFSYNVFYLAFNLRDILKLAGRFLSLEGFNLLSFHRRDHGACDGTELEPWIRGVLAKWGISEADGEITLVALPRILGYVFNPVSFWFCHDRQGTLRAVLSEVRNTFGERHCYLSFHDDHGAITPKDRLRAEKVFHVSPFMDVEGHYMFRFACSASRIGVWIDHHTADGLMLVTSISGKRIPLTPRNLLWCFFRYPLVTFKVIGLIHIEAVRLLAKGVRYRSKPLPPMTEISR